MRDLIIISNVADDPFAIDIGHACGQSEDMADLIYLKTYTNTEFCPRYLTDDHDMNRIGRSLEGKIVVICSAATDHTRGSLAMRTMILARAAKDNNARKVVLVEPDLFFSAQDRGPHRGEDEKDRSAEDLKKFDGEAFTARLYAELLRTAGVDAVITVHNHSTKVQKVFSRAFGGEFYNLMLGCNKSDPFLDSLKCQARFAATESQGDDCMIRWISLRSSSDGKGQSSW